MELRILPQNVANMIAAGEVVQRPASVVKELLENALDAGADKVSVVVTDAGRTLIRVVDNGCGMSPDDAVLCFERHATSKIATPEDLSAILTFGFRGEALASIAAVSEVTLRTRLKGAEVGCEVVFAASEQVSLKEVATPEGSSFSVRNLFYNVPARRKFLKSDTVELRHIVEEFTRVALTRPDVSFTLTSNNRDLFVLKPARTLKYRILDILGQGVVGEVTEIDAETSLSRIYGFIGRPESARKTLGNQFFFVNGRYFRSGYLHKAVMKAYEGLIPEGVTPSYFIYIETDPSTIDVNIHPTKTEIKFEDDSVMFQTIFATVKEALGRSAASGSIDFNNPEQTQMPHIGSSFDEYRPQSAPEVSFDPNYDPFAALSEPQGGSKGADSGFHTPPQAAVSRSQDYGKLFEDRVMDVSDIIVVQDKYILTKSASGVMAVNIRRARERLLFDRFIKALSASGHVSQSTLFPVRVQVGVENRMLFDENAEMLASLGFDISPFGNDTVVVSGVPEGYSAEQGKVERMVADLVLILASGVKGALKETMAASMAEKFAFLGASGSGQIASPLQAKRLVDSLLASDNPEFTSGGKRIISVIPLAELDKRF
ncbi:MAG: DNA mismatch repair endonuclease MutL [Bacteroidales bacterium]|nr:DNA mismatch repair endonuclease MutL [Bacteroidales bacterium]